MSKFNVHEWNYKRRLDEITPAEETVAIDAVNTFQDAINKLKSSGLVNNAEAIALEAFNTRMIKKVAQLRGDIKENLSEVNLSKALPTIAARNVERNNNINFDIESMMDMVGDAGKDENSKEAQILFRASNASAELEKALTDLQIHFDV